MGTLDLDNNNYDVLFFIFFPAGAITTIICGRIKLILQETNWCMFSFLVLLRISLTWTFIVRNYLFISAIMRSKL